MGGGSGGVGVLRGGSGGAGVQAAVAAAPVDRERNGGVGSPREQG